MEIIETNTLDRAELQIFTGLNEAQLLHFCEPDEGLFIAESLKVIQRALSSGYNPVSVLAEKKYYQQAQSLFSAQDIPVYLCDSHILREITGYNLNEGFLCAMKRRRLPEVSGLCRSARRIAVFEGVVNPTNIGAVFRSAAAMNIDAVLLTPACADPLYRRAIRVSMGNVFLVPWTYITDSERDWQENGMALLREMGFRTAAMALRDNTLDIRDSRLKEPEKLAILLGTEGEGLSDRTIGQADFTVKIPMTNEVDSLNVAAASAVAFWELAMNV